MMMRSLLFLCAVAFVACGNDTRSQSSGDGSVWVLSSVDRSVTVIDPGSAAVVRRIDLGFRTDPTDLVHWSEWIWVGSSVGILQRVSTATHQITDTVPVDHEVWRVSAAAHGVYSMDAESSLVSRHDLTSAAVISTLDPPDRIHAMAAGPDSLAVVVGDRREVHFYEPGATQSRVVTAEPGAGDMVFGFGSYWIYHSDGRLLRLDSQSAAIEEEIDIGPDLYFPTIAIGEDSVWISVQEREEIIRVSPATNDIVLRIAVAGMPEHLAVRGTDVWVVLPQDDAVVRIDAGSGAQTARVTVDFPVRVVIAP